MWLGSFVVAGLWHAVLSLSPRACCVHWQLKRQLATIQGDGRNGTNPADSTDVVVQEIITHEGSSRNSVVVTSDFVADTIERKPSRFEGPRAIASDKNATTQEHEEQVIFKSPFVTINESKQVNETGPVVVTREKVIANASDIMSIYLLMFAPLGMIWITLRHLNLLDKYYLVILPLALCLFVIGVELVNQSLAALIESPNAITAFQASAMSIGSGFWLFAHVCCSGAASNKIETCPLLWRLAKWSVVAFLFAGYQLISHVVSLKSTLTERTIFMNLTPLIALICERGLSMRPQVNFCGQMMLFTMFLGAVLFGLQNPDSSLEGVKWLALLIIVLIIYRLAQRCYLMDHMALPISLLTCFDGLMLAFPSGVLTAISQEAFVETWESWLADPSVAVMLALSTISFTGAHVCGLLVLQAQSTTSCFVYHNFANIFVVMLGVLFFNDHIFKNSLALLGICISLLGGLVYSASVWIAKSQEQAYTKA